MEGYTPNQKRMRTRGDFASSLGRSVFELMESDWGSIELAPYFDCETLGRLACVSRRTLAINRTVRAFTARWRDAADALDQMFPLVIVDGDLSYDGKKGADQWEEESGRDPRYAFIFPSIQGHCSPEDGTVTQEAWAAGRVAWRLVDPILRVSLMVSWQTGVCDAVRACPADIGKGFMLGRIDWRFAGHYNFVGYTEDEAMNVLHSAYSSMDRTSDAMKLILKLVYIKCCEIDRCGDSYTQAADVFYNGWINSDWVEYTLHHFACNLFTDCDEDSYVMTKGNVWILCHSIEKIPSMTPYVGARTTNLLTICRGEGDLPLGWEKLFDDRDYLVL